MNNSDNDNSKEFFDKKNIVDHNEIKKDSLIKSIADNKFGFDDKGRPYVIIEHPNGKVSNKEDYKAQLEQFTFDELHDLDKKSRDKSGIHHLRAKYISLKNSFNYAEASEEIVIYLKNNYKFVSIKDDNKKEIWVYVDGVYVPNGVSVIKETVRIVLGSHYDIRSVNMVIDKIEAESFIEMKIFFNQQMDNPYLLPVQNGILNIKNRELLPFSPEYYFFNKINAFYNPEVVPCDNFIKFIGEIVSNPKEDIKVMQEIFGYCLCRKYDQEKAFIFEGSKGRNGKSKLLSVLKTLVGAENSSAVDLHTLEEKDFAVCDLQNKLVNIAGELSKKTLTSDNVFKKLTGGDTVSADRKFKNRIEFVNYAKLIFATNELSTVVTTSDAFWQRWVMIEFPFRFLSQKEIDDLDDDEKEICKLRDINLIDKLITQESLNGVLLWALDGFDRLERNKDFSTSQTSRMIKASWKRKSNSVSAFIEDHIVESHDHIKKSDFKKYYLDYCRLHKVKSLGDKDIKFALQSELSCTEGRVRDNIQDYTYWDNISFKGVEIKLDQVKSSEEFIDDREDVKLSMGLKMQSRSIEKAKDVK